MPKLSWLHPQHQSHSIRHLSYRYWQGPPGTGKSYVGARVARLLTEHLAGQESPILCVCFTNHALDSFLLEIVEQMGIEEGKGGSDDGIIRVGTSYQPRLRVYMVGGGASVTPAVSSLNCHANNTYHTNAPCRCPAGGGSKEPRVEPYLFSALKSHFVTRMNGAAISMAYDAIEYLGHGFDSVQVRPPIPAGENLAFSFPNMKHESTERHPYFIFPPVPRPARWRSQASMRDIDAVVEAARSVGSAADPRTLSLVALLTAGGRYIARSRKNKKNKKNKKKPIQGWVDGDDFRRVSDFVCGFVLDLYSIVF